MTYDAVVIGARCAGSATAMLLARQGLRVLAVDRGRYGTDTLSTHALMRGGVLQLERWGLLDALVATGVPPVHKTCFHYADEVIEIPIEPRYGVDALYGPRRFVLDALLDDAARDQGVEVRHHVRLVDLMRDAHGRICGVVLQDGAGVESRITAGLVIGADGRGSTVARKVRARAYREGQHSSGVIYGYWAGLKLDGYRWYFRPGVSAGVIPTHGGEACVFVSVASSRFLDELRHDLVAGYHEVLAETEPALAQAVAAAKQIGSLRGHPGERGFLRECHGPGWALVGDAGYSKDPITAHGMTDAFRDAELLARAVADGSPDAWATYKRQRDELSMDFFNATDDVASYRWSLESLQEMHLRANKAMGREVKWLASLDGAPEIVAQVSSGTV